jgi:hypothetical protein
MGAYIGANRWRQLLSGQEANSSVYMGGNASDPAQLGSFCLGTANYQQQQRLMSANSNAQAIHEE